jgi:ankyrin repeat protein
MPNPQSKAVRDPSTTTTTRTTTTTSPPPTSTTPVSSNKTPQGDDQFQHQLLSSHDSFTSEFNSELNSAIQSLNNILEIKQASNNDSSNSLSSNHDLIQQLAHDINIVHSQTEEITTQRIVAIVKAANTLLQEFVSIKQERAELDAFRLEKQNIEEELRRYKLLKGKYKQLKQKSRQDLGVSIPGPNSMVEPFDPKEGQWELNEESLRRIRRDETILHNYCQHINSTPLIVFRYLIEIMGKEVDPLDGNDLTPFHIALSQFKRGVGDANILTYLLNKTVDINTKDTNGCTLLHWACISINTLPLDIFKSFLKDRCCDINIQDYNHDTPLHHALQNFNTDDGGDINTLIFLLNRKDLYIHRKNKEGLSLLHLVCKHINSLPLSIFKHFIETKGADINARDDDNDTPLHHALRQVIPGSAGVDTLAYLLSRDGVDFQSISKDGYLALLSLPPAPFKKFISHSIPLHWAFSFFSDGCDIDNIIHLLAQPGVQLDEVNEKGYTCIDCAFLPREGSSSKLIKYIIDNNLLKYSSNPKSLLSRLCKWQHIPFESIKNLCENSIIDYFYCDPNSGSPLHCLADQDGILTKDDNIADIVEYLIHQGVPVNLKNSKQQTALDYTAYSTNPLTRTVLIMNGAKEGEDC